MPYPCSVSNVFAALSPLRPSDLPHSQNAVLEHTEKLIALDRLELERVEPAAWGGFILRLSGSPRLEEWWTARPNKKKHLWFDSTELGDFGTQVFFSRSIDCIYAAACSWLDAPEAAADLRTRYLGPDLLAMHGPAIFQVTAQEITRHFQLEERPLNSTTIPCYCRLKWGYLQRFPWPDIPASLDYLLNIAQPQDVSLPILFKLGANLCAILAFSPAAEEAGELRVGLCCQWDAGLAIDELGAWLRTFPSSNHPNPRPLKWIAPPCFSSVGSRDLLEEATPLATP